MSDLHISFLWFFGYYAKLKEKIDKLKTNKDIFLLNAIKNELIKEAKSRIKSISYDEQIIENVEKFKIRKYNY